MCFSLSFFQFFSFSDPSEQTQRQFFGWAFRLFGRWLKVFVFRQKAARSLILQVQPIDTMPHSLHEGFLPLALPEQEMGHLAMDIIVTNGGKERIMGIEDMT